MALQRGEAALVEHLGDEAHVLHHGDRLAVAHGDPGRLLAAMLEGEQSEVGQLGDRLARRIDAEHPAGFADAVFHYTKSSGSGPAGHQWG
ncbi:hypothetical protein D3C83_33840 [compost metagenome]